MLSLDSVSKTYTIGKERAVEAVRQVSLDVGRGDFVVITGRSGSGKTTLLHLAAGLTRPTATPESRQREVRLPPRPSRGQAACSPR